ncbi:cation transporter [Geothrix mesophila]|uniref:cation transporter n=1 Tax=Geothrix mesophila TaxID=2922723 RepID=UPI001FADFF02|nr:cation transporter [Geothrix sp. SG198]
MSGPDWHRRALWLAGFTIAYNLLEGLVSMAFGWADDSVALFGFGADSFIEVASALLVLWKLLDHGNLERERKATLGIGRLFLFLAAGIAGGAVLQLTARAHPPTTVPGLVISALSLAFMVFLWRAKLRAAQALDSATVAADAACSRACIQLSVVLFAGSLLFLLVPALWWVDAAAALGLAFLIGKEGLGMTRAAKSSCFTGGCGCGH